jgi:hypothetical protein
MESLDVVSKRVGGDKALQKIEVKSEREISITNAAIDVEREVYFYFLEQIQLLPGVSPSKEFSQQFNAAMHDAFRKEYLELFKIQKEFITPFINSDWIIQNTYLEVTFNISEEDALRYAIAQFKKIFICANGPDKLSICELKKQIDLMASISDEHFSEQFLSVEICSLAKPGYLEFKNNIVKAYQQYFKKAEEHLACAKHVMSDLTMADFDEYRKLITELMDKDPQRKQERIVLELMRMHALYPQHQEQVLPLILEQCKPQPIKSGEQTFRLGNYIGIVTLFDAKTSSIHLPRIAQELEKEGLQPPHIQSLLLLTNVPASVAPQNVDQKSKLPATGIEIDEEGEEVGNVLEGKSKLQDTKKKENSEMILQPPQQGQLIVAPPTEVQQGSFENTIKIFLVADEILREFQDLPSSSQYQDKNEKLTAFQKVENILRNAKTMTDYEAAFKLMAPYINRHKNLLTDMIFGNKNTDTWKKVMKQIREPATNTLLSEVALIEDTDAKIKRLKKACEMPLFNQHRNNHWYTGGIGDTHAVSVIKKEIATLEEQKKQLSMINR